MVGPFELSVKFHLNSYGSPVERAHKAALPRLPPSHTHPTLKAEKVGELLQLFFFSLPWLSILDVPTAYLALATCKCGAYRYLSCLVSLAKGLGSISKRFLSNFL